MAAENTVPVSWLPTVVVVVALLAAGVWCVRVSSAIGTHNAIPSRMTAQLPIRSLPERPVMQLAFARGPEDVKTILEVGEKSQEKNVGHVSDGNSLDTWRLVPGYTLLFVLLTLLIVRGTQNAGRLLFRIGLVITAIVALADLVENYYLGQILSAPADMAVISAALAFTGKAAFTKWTGLGLLLIGLGAVASLQLNWRRWLSPLLLPAGVWMLARFGRHAIDRFFG